MHEKNKRAVFDGLKQLCATGPQIAADLYSDDASCFAFHPVNELESRDAIVDRLWSPLLKALPDIERRDSIVIAGQFEDRQTVAMTGHYQGTFTEPLHDIPPTNGHVLIRYGEVYHVENGKIATSYVLHDMLDLMRQAGCWPIAPSVGWEGSWPGPATQDGVRPDSVESEAGAESLGIIKQMHGGLLKFDGRDIESMDHQKYWTKDFLWYGPSGIGSSRGLDGFRAHHQIPFLRAFPDRTVGVHFGEVGDGDYAVTGGWPSVLATHTGPDWLAMPPTGKKIEMRVMDFYRVENGLVAENWVPIDIIDILRQMGVDVFDRMRHLNGEPRMSL